LLGNHKFIGRSIIFLTDASYSTDQTIPKPRWHKVTIGNNENESQTGEILCSFSILEEESKDNKKVDLMKGIYYEEYNVEINALGLRNL